MRPPQIRTRFRVALMRRTEGVYLKTETYRVGKRHEIEKLSSADVSGLNRENLIHEIFLHYLGPGN